MNAIEKGTLVNNNLSYQDFAILLALETNPSMPMTELAQLLGITRITAKRKVDDLFERGIIRKIIAIYDPLTLGLQRTYVLAQVQSITDLGKLEQACDEHPYTHYRARAFGGAFHLFMQFDIPKGSTKFLQGFFEQLKKRKIVSTFEIFTSIGIGKNRFADLTRFNMEISRWHFSWKEWFKLTERASKTLPEVPEIKIDLSTFNPKQFQILRFLTMDGAIKQSELKDKLKMSKTQTHRDYNYVLNHYIETKRLLFDRSIFDLTEFYLGIGYNVPDKIKAELYHTLENNPPPFQLTYNILEGGHIILSANMSPAQASEFAFSMWEKIPRSKIFNLDTQKSKLYWFYPENFDFTLKQWKVSKEYMITEPLEKLKKNGEK
ncbi:MAG: hypothetical protein DRO63_05500 [Candidatus Gerdarchaeota archaeon]|nr:MAG: hypothetical protein DRO63_05500 [Candidatus Gerdarchaeota archaeon]